MERVAGAFASRVARLERRDGRLWLEAAAGDEPVAVTVRYLRPLTGRSELVFLDESQKEVVSLPGVEALTAEQRGLVEAALAARYCLPRVQRVNRIHVQFGTRYWDVETDLGPRRFALREPGKNVLWLSDVHLVLRDTAGNRFEVPDLAILDRRSRRWIELSL